MKIKIQLTIYVKNSTLSAFKKLLIEIIFMKLELWHARNICGKDTCKKNYWI